VLQIQSFVGGDVGIMKQTEQTFAAEFGEVQENCHCANPNCTTMQHPLIVQAYNVIFPCPTSLQVTLCDVVLGGGSGSTNTGAVNVSQNCQNSLNGSTGANGTQGTSSTPSSSPTPTSSPTSSPSPSGTTTNTSGTQVTSSPTTPSSTPSSGLSAGAIAGICILVFAFVVCIVIILI